MKVSERIKRPRGEEKAQQVFKGFLQIAVKDGSGHHLPGGVSSVVPTGSLWAAAVNCALLSRAESQSVPSALFLSFFLSHRTSVQVLFVSD